MAKAYKRTHHKISQQLFILFIILFSIYFGVRQVQRYQSLRSGASLTGEASITATLSFASPEPPNPQTVGSTFSTNIVANTDDQPIFGVDAIVRFDPSKLQVISVTPIADNGFSSYPSLKFNNNQGLVNVSANIGTGNSQSIVSSSLAVAKLTFQVISEITSSDLSYDFTLGNRNDSNIVAEFSSQRKSVTDILGSVSSLTVSTTPNVLPSPSPSPSISPSPSPSPSPSISPSPSPSPIAQIPVKLFIDLQGKTLSSLTSLAPVILSYRFNNLESSENIILNMASDGSTQLELNPGQYVFLLKTPSYLMRRYGTLSDPITISSTTSQLDFSTQPLLGGDFNNDGIINEIDYSTHFLPAFASTNFAIDLDGSGQVNNLDFAIMRANWGLIDDTIN